MNRTFVIFFLAFGLLPLTALAGVKVTSLNFTPDGANGFINVSLEGRSSEAPEVKVTGKIIQVTLARADHFGPFNKEVKGVKLSAAAVGGAAVIKAILPYEVAASAVSLGWKNKNIEIIFPQSSKIPAAAAVKAAPVPVKTEVMPKAAAISKDTLNEDYLNRIISESNKRIEKNSPVAATAPVLNGAIEADKAKDEVKLIQAAPAVKPEPIIEHKKSDGFSFAGYAAKFTAFLGLVLGLFYAIVHVLKKGIFNRGKLGFLNNAQMIQVLSTTYVSPKRSLMVVKVHNQIFLVANSESGLQFLSEMKDTSGLLKEGEKAITGMNFDTNLGAQSLVEDSLIKLKEDIMQSTPVPDGKIRTAAADSIVKFSDELKKKAKKLKPIEFN